ncbi:MAG: GTP cyclohydrolase I FolE, partial [Betaproteobacteria bacterium HGW-Betaproteobacteria-17]
MADACDHGDCHVPRGSLGIPQTGPFDPLAFEQAVNAMLAACGIAPDSVHTGRTAERVRELWQKRLLGGYAIEPAAALGEGFADDRDDMVVVRGIAVHGVCPHHLVPFRGVAHVAYIPGKHGRICGLSKLARVVDVFARRPQVQERLTSQIADTIVEHLDPA